MKDTDRVAWPNGKRVAVMLTFDFDADTLWLSRDPENAMRPGTVSQGKYGAKVGVPKILDTLREANVPATFFVPGWTAETYPDQIQAIQNDGHEIGHHGYLHEWIDPREPEKEEEAFVRGLEALRAKGINPQGYRSPAWETSPNMISLLSKYGLRYDSSFMDMVNPYVHQTGVEDGPVVELPVHWSLDDAPFMMFSTRTPRTIMTNSHLKEIWQDEFEEIRRWGGLFNLTMHPQFTGRPSRIMLLREMIDWLQTFPDVWFARGHEVCDSWLVSQDGKKAATE